MARSPRDTEYQEYAGCRCAQTDEISGTRLELACPDIPAHIGRHRSDDDRDDVTEARAIIEQRLRCRSLSHGRQATTRPVAEWEP